MGDLLDDEEDDEEEETFSTQLPPGALPARNVLSLMVLSGPEQGRCHEVRSRRAVIGRSGDAAVHIPDPFISRRHAQIERDPRGRVLIRDLSSRYGVYVEGKRVREAEIGDGHRIQLSSETVVRVRFQDPQETELLDQLQQAAMTDALTGLANRGYLMQRLEQELAFSDRHSSPLAILMIDLDHFKPINDTYGHAKGDEALTFVARALKETVRLEDVVARYGGDEFIIISRGYERAAVQKFGERLRAELAARVSAAGEPLSKLSMSVGIACHDPSSDGRAEPRDLIVRADAALYASKSSGRNQVSIWSPPSRGVRPLGAMDDEDTQRVDWPPSERD